MTGRAKKIAIITTGVLIGLSVTGIFLWQRIKRLLNYELSTKYVRLKTASLTKLQLDVGLNFKNKSDLEIVISKQEYDIYLNDIFLTTLKSDAEQIIYPESISVLNIEVDTNPKQLLSQIPNKLDVVTNLKEQRLKLVSKLWVKFGMFNLPIKYTYEDKIKNWS